MGRAGLTDFLATFVESLFLHSNETVTDCKSGYQETLLDCSASQDEPRLILKLIEVPAANNAKEDDSWCKSIQVHLERQFETTLTEESRVRRTKYEDTKIHALLYLLSPDDVLLNRGLSPLDFSTLKALCTRVNVIPCLSKSDTVTLRQFSKIQTYLRNSFENIEHIYDFAEDEDSNLLRSLVPFRIFSAEEMSLESNGQRRMGIYVDNTVILGRQFSWNVLDVNNTAHCDFLALRALLLVSHSADLRETTRENYYEDWRFKMMKRQSFFGSDTFNKLVIEE